MPETNKTKKSGIAEFLEIPENAALSNGEIARRLNCNEGSVRRARKPDNATLLAKIGELEKELKRYRANAPRPKKVKSETMTLFGE